MRSACLPGSRVPDDVRDAQKLRGFIGGGLDRPERPEAELGHVGELGRWIEAGEAVGAHDHSNAAVDGVSEVGLLAFEEVAHLLDRPGRDFAARHPVLVHQGEVDVEGRHERHVPLEHQVDALVVDQVAVLDAGDAGAKRVLDPGGAFGVGQGALDSSRLRLLDDRPDLLDRELAGVGAVRGREHSAGGHDLDPVRSGPDLQPRGPSDRVRPSASPGGRSLTSVSRMRRKGSSRRRGRRSGTEAGS